ncbi:hypothetical protein [Aeromicrobium sp. P5_D10]
MSKLLTHSRLRDAQRIGDLALTRSRGDHGAQRHDTTQPREILVAARIAILGQQSHKETLSRSIWL